MPPYSCKPEHALHKQPHLPHMRRPGMAVCLLTLALALSACSSDQGALVSDAQATQPTATFTASATPLPPTVTHTPVPIPTNTPLPTNTPAPTDTPIPT